MVGRQHALAQLLPVRAGQDRAELRLAEQDASAATARPSTVMLESMRSSSIAASDRFCTSSTTSRQRRPACRWSRTICSNRRSSVDFSVPGVSPRPKVGHRQPQQIVARDLRRHDARNDIGVAVELRPKLLDQRGLAGADLAGDDDEAFLLRQPVDQMRDRPAVPARSEEEPAVGRQQERAGRRGCRICRTRCAIRRFSRCRGSACSGRCRRPLWPRLPLRNEYRKLLLPYRKSDTARPDWPAIESCLPGLTPSTRPRSDPGSHRRSPRWPSCRAASRAAR